MLQEGIEFIKSRKKVTLAIVLINICVFFVLDIMGNTENGIFMAQYGALNPFYLVVKDPAKMMMQYLFEEGNWYRLITAMFLHFGFEHMGYNMLLLIFAGNYLEEQIGSARFFVIYFGSGILGNIVSLYLEFVRVDFHISAGASGAIFGVIGALVWLAVANYDQLSENFRNRLFVMVILSILDGYTQKGIDNAAHIGGLFSGIILCLFFHLLFIAGGKQKKR